MPYHLRPFADASLTPELLEHAIDRHQRLNVPRLHRLWNYFRNPLDLGPVLTTGRPWYRQAQEAGLPTRLVGRDALRDERVRREVVIENDIAWRVQAMVDFLFGRAPTIEATGASASRRSLIEKIAARVWEASGGVTLMQDMALVGHVAGFVDLIVRVDPLLTSVGPLADEGAILDAASRIRIELIEPSRSLPIIGGGDYRRLSAYGVVFERETLRVNESSERERELVVELFGPHAWQRYENDALVAQDLEPPFAGELPIVHVQNLSQPFRYEGLSDVEPLVPLQDELNTRLSDRASRVTMQCFKMYLAKGLSGFTEAPIGPGLLWNTDNIDASIEAFGGDADSPSESAHIEEIREALDKMSGVPPLAGGVVRARLGNLSSATALRITLMSLLSKTERKRITYGAGVTGAARLALVALNHLGIFTTDERERSLSLAWPALLDASLGGGESPAPV